jgi:D-lactate dehydrogenase
VGIDTGKFIKKLREEEVKSKKSAEWVVDHFALVEKSIGVGVSLGHAAEKVIGVNGVKSISVVAEKVTGTKLPKWNHAIPHSDSKVSQLWRTRRRLESSDSIFIYFPSCISRQLGTPPSRISNTKYRSLPETFITIANRADIYLHIPANANGHCCGMPFSSKGYTQVYQASLHKTLLQMWEWSEHGKYPIVIDTTSCTHTLKTGTSMRRSPSRPKGRSLSTKRHTKRNSPACRWNWSSCRSGYVTVN